MQVTERSREALRTPACCVMSAAAGPQRFTVVGSLADALPAATDGTTEGMPVGVDEDGRYVMRVVDLVRCARVCGVSPAHKALKQPGAHEGLADRLGCAGHELPKAKWGSKSQWTCEVRHTAAVLEWADENSGGVLVLSLDERAALVTRVQDTVREIVRERLDGYRTNMAASLDLQVDTVDPRVTALREECERKCDTRLSQARRKLKNTEQELQKTPPRQKDLQDAPSSSTAGVAAKLAALAVPSRMLLPLAPLESLLSLSSSYAAASRAAHEPSVGVAAFLSRAGADQTRETCRCPGAGGRCVRVA